MSTWDHDEKFVGVAEVQIDRSWEDYEIGTRFIGTAVSQDLNAYLDRNARKSDRRVFFGQFDLYEKPEIPAATYKKLVKLIGKKITLLPDPDEGFFDEEVVILVSVQRSHTVVTVQSVEHSLFEVGYEQVKLK